MEEKEERRRNKKNVYLYAYIPADIVWKLYTSCRITNFKYIPRQVFNPHNPSIRPLDLHHLARHIKPGWPLPRTEHGGNWLKSSRGLSSSTCELWEKKRREEEKEERVLYILAGRRRTRVHERETDHGIWKMRGWLPLEEPGYRAVVDSAR